MQREREKEQTENLKKDNRTTISQTSKEKIVKRQNSATPMLFLIYETVIGFYYIFLAFFSPFVLTQPILKTGD